MRYASRMTILLASDFDAGDRDRWLALLRAALPGEHLVHERTGTDDGAIDVAIVANPPPGALAGLSGLRLVQSLWAGVDRLLADPTVPADVPLARMVDPAMNTAMAETALWAVLHLHRDFVDYAGDQRAGRWRPRPQRRADDVAVTVLGLGEMGCTVARRLADNGYRVTGWSRRPAAPVPGVATRAGEAALPAALAEADVVVNLLPLTAQTRGLFDARRLAQLRRGAALVNLARGAHVVDADLLEALDRGQVRHAVLDVFHAEPLPPAHAYWSHPRVTMLPHVAAQTDPRSAAAVAADNVRALRAGQPLRHRVDRARGY